MTGAPLKMNQNGGINQESPGKPGYVVTPKYGRSESRLLFLTVCALEVEERNEIVEVRDCGWQESQKEGTSGVEGWKAVQTKGEEDVEGWGGSRRHPAPSAARVQAPQTLAVCHASGAVVGSDAFTAPSSNVVGCSQPAQWFPVPWWIIWSLRKQCFSDEESGNFEGKTKGSPKPRGWAG